MTLRQLQSEFTLLQAKFVLAAYNLGYELTDGDAFRDPRVHGAMGTKQSYGHRNSCHKIRLARDYNLFKDGKYLPATADYKILGELWESMHPLARWGGRFEDGNHFSFEYEGHM